MDEIDEAVDGLAAASDDVKKISEILKIKEN